MLGRGDWDAILLILKLAAAVTFAHTVGEFGRVLTIGGNMPDNARVVSVQTYDHVEALEYAQGQQLIGGMLVFSVLVLLLLYIFNPANRLQ